MHLDDPSVSDREARDRERPPVPEGDRADRAVDERRQHVDGELEVEAVTYADQSKLGMTWSPLGMTRAPCKLIVRARLIHEERAGR